MPPDKVYHTILAHLTRNVLRHTKFYLLHKPLPDAWLALLQSRSPPLPILKLHPFREFFLIKSKAAIPGHIPIMMRSPLYNLRWRNPYVVKDLEDSDIFVILRNVSMEIS